MGKAPLLSVILLSYNRLELTKIALANLREAVAMVDAEIIVVDNASSDGTQEYLAGQGHGRVRVIQNHKNLYFGGGNNSGLEIARGRYLLFTQNDFFFSDHTIPLMLCCFQELPKCGMLGVGGGIVARHGLTELSDWWKNPLRQFHYIPVDFISGCCMLVNRDFVHKHGIRFDTAFRLYWEDVDISHQVAMAGKKLYMLHNGLAGTMHMRSATITPLLGEVERERIRAMSYAYYADKWNGVPIPRLQELTYGAFTPDFMASSEVKSSFSRLRPLPDELLPYEADITAIQTFEYQEMAGQYSDAVQGLRALWENGKTNFMALRNLCRIRRTTGTLEEIHDVMETLRVELKRDMPELFRDRLVKHYQLALSQLAQLAEVRQEYPVASSFMKELLGSARTKETREFCLQKIYDLKQMTASPAFYGEVND